MRALLRADGIIASPGVYDGYSAKMVEKAGFTSCCTTGAGLANARLGVPDVGLMSLSDNLDACRVVARAIDIPVMADADNGYGNAVTVYEVTRLFEETGVVGINIEDQVIPKRCGHMEGKAIIDADEMAKKIEAACDARRDDDFVVLARTDAIAVGGMDEALRRIDLYCRAGADIIFPDAVRAADDIKRIVDASPVPVSINMGFGIRQRPTTPLLSICELERLGVKRVSLPRMLPAAAIQAMQSALDVLAQSIASGEVVDRPDLLVSIDAIWDLMGESRIRELDARYATADAQGPSRPYRLKAAG